MNPSNTVESQKPRLNRPAKPTRSAAAGCGTLSGIGIPVCSETARALSS
jgi:hypothetical protein